MGGIRTPRSVKGAQALCERFAAIEAQRASIEGQRDSAIAAANAASDAELEPLLAERAQLAEKLEPWWQEAGPGLTEGKRKSIELGGCIIGSRTGKPSLGVPADQAKAKAALGKSRWGKELLAVSVNLDKRAIGKALDGRNGKALAEMGFVMVPGSEDFILERAEQGGTPGKLA